MQGGNAQVPTGGYALIYVLDGRNETIEGRQGVTRLEVCISEVWESDLENFSALERKVYRSSDCIAIGTVGHNTCLAKYTAYVRKEKEETACKGILGYSKK